MARLLDHYNTTVAAELQTKFGVTNKMAIPKLDKIVINMGVGRATQDKALIEAAVDSLANSRGAVRFARGDLRGAVADFDRALDADPGYAEAYHNRGVARHSLGDLGPAIADFDRALRLDPGRAGSYYDRGVARLSRLRVPFRKRPQAGLGLDQQEARFAIGDQVPNSGGDTRHLHAT